MTRVGPYLLGPELARGAMGVVYRARHPELDREVALKLMLETLPGEELARFRLEGEAAARVRHPHVLAVHAFDVEGGRPYLVMDLAVGGSLRERLRRVGALPAREAVELVWPLADALATLHAAQILHRDLKPENVLFDGEARPLLADLGLARVLDRQTRHTASGAPLGTPAYMAPEQARGERDAIDARSDVYGLGALLYELLCGSPPFREATLLATLEAVVSRPPASLRSQVPGLDARLEAICLRCLEKDPAARYPSAAALRDALGSWLEGADPAGSGRGLAPRLGGVLLAAGLGGLALLLAGAAVYYGTGQRELAPARIEQVEPRLEAKLLAPPDREGWVRLGGRAGPPGRGPIRIAGSRGELLAELEVPLAGEWEARVPCRAAGRNDFVIRLDGSELRVELSAVCPPLPAWYLALSERPPLSEGVVPLEAPGDYRNEPDGSLLRWIPPGEALLALEPEPVRIPLQQGFYIGKYELSAAQLWRYRNLRGSIEPEPEHGDRPACEVDYYTALEYCRWAGARLPTAAEWALAAYGDRSANRTTVWSGRFDPRSCDLEPNKLEGYASPIDERESTPEGVAGLAGGVREWIGDVAPDPAAGPDPWGLAAAPPSGALRSRETRGGCYLSAAREAAPGARGSFAPQVPRPDVGLRLVRSALHPEPGPLRWTLRYALFPDFHRYETHAADGKGVPGPPLETLAPTDVQPDGRTLELHDPWDALAPPGLPTLGFALAARCAATVPAGTWLIEVPVADDGYRLRVRRGREVLAEAGSWRWQVLYHQRLRITLSEPAELDFELEYCQLGGAKGIRVVPLAGVSPGRLGPPRSLALACAEARSWG